MNTWMGMRYYWPARPHWLSVQCETSEVAAVCGELVDVYHPCCLLYLAAPDEIPSRPSAAAMPPLQWLLTWGPGHLPALASNLCCQWQHLTGDPPPTPPASVAPDRR